jgi:hypothetical protein
MPRGVGRGCGWRKRDVVEVVWRGISAWGEEEGEGEEAMAIALEMRWAITHPTIFSRLDDVQVPVEVVGVGIGDERRKR